MNKIYKVIWNKVRNCYVVASEFAKSHTKAPQGVASLMSVSLLVCMLSVGFVRPVFADETHFVKVNSTDTAATNYNGDGAVGNNSVAIGVGAKAEGKNSIAIGSSAKAKGEGAIAFGEGAVSQGKGTVAFIGGNESYGDYSMVWGFNNVAGISADGRETYTGATAFGTGSAARNDGATAMGNWSIAEGENSVAMGNQSHTHAYAKASFAMGQESHTLDTGSFAGGTDSIAGGFNSFAHGYTAEAVGSTAIAMGDDAKAIGDEAVALGYNSKAFGDYSVAILGGRTGDGTFKYNEAYEMYDTNVTKNAIGAFAVGFGSVALKDYTVAIGRHATVNNDKGIALGEDALVSADDATALGYGSVATEENVISVGHKEEDLNYKGAAFGSELKRRIVNVADGTSATDAATVGQTVQLVDGTNTTIEEVGKNDIGQKKYKVNVTADGQVASEDTRLVTGDTVYQALASYTADGVVKKNETKAVSGDTVYTEVRPSENGTYVQTTSTTGDNLKALDDQVTANTQTIAGHTTDITNLKDLSNITDAGNEVIRSQAKLAINVKGADLATVTKTDENGIDTYTVSVKADGKVAAGNTSIVTGDTVYQAIQEATAGSTDKNAVKYDTAEKDKVTLAGNNGTVLDNVSEGTVSADSKQAVNGSQLYETNQNVADNTQKITDLGNQVGALETRVGTVSEGQYVSSSNSMGENINALDDQLKDVSEGLQGVQTDVTNMQTDITNLQNDAANKADKDLSNITDNGKEVIRNTVQPALDEKANVDASNIDGQVWADKLGTGKIVEGDNGLVKGATVYEALQSVQESALVEADGATGAIRIGAKPRYDSYSTVDVSNSRGGGRVITGVVTDPSNKMSAANVAYVDSIGENIINGVNGGFNRLNNRIDKVGAGAAAMASLAPLPYGADEKWSLSAGIGQYHGSTAAAVGAFFRPKDNILLNIRGTVGNDSNMLGAGITFALDKMQTSSPTKKQLINTVNAQAQKITEQEEKIAQQDARLAQQDARLAEQDAKIARLEALVNQAVSR